MCAYSTQWRDSCARTLLSIGDCLTFISAPRCLQLLPFQWPLSMLTTGIRRDNIKRISFLRIKSSFCCAQTLAFESHAIANVMKTHLRHVDDLHTSNQIICLLQKLEPNNTVTMAQP